MFIHSSVTPLPEPGPQAHCLSSSGAVQLRLSWSYVWCPDKVVKPKYL